MNISLKKSNVKQSSSAIGYGLNKRGNSVFNDDVSSSEGEGASDGEKNPTRSSVQQMNQDLLVEQAALRKRAESVMNSAVSSDIYDYDGQYESFSHGINARTNNQTEGSKSKEIEEERKKSRYICSLLNQAKERKYEREIILERKIAREQAAEEKNSEFLGKDKFVTKSYKQKLEEREAWKRQDDAKNKMNEENDPIKKKAEGLLGFYRNVGGGQNETSETIVKGESNMSKKGIEKHEKGDMSISKEHLSLQRSNDPGLNENSTFKKRHDSFDEIDHYEEDAQIEEELEVEARRVRTLEKILKARDRYFNRVRESEGSVPLD